MKKLNTYKLRISKSVAKIREENGWSQIKLSNLLGISQPLLSAIESGKASLDTERFFLFLETFHLGLADFFPMKKNDYFQILLEAARRFGDYQDLEEGQDGPSIIIEELYDINKIIHEILLLVPSHRHVMSLAPLMVKHVPHLNFDAIAMKLYDFGVDGRIWWLADGVLWAVRHRLKWHLQKRYATIYERTAEILDIKGRSSNRFFSLRKAYPLDIFDQDIISKRILEVRKASRDALATRWRIITTIKQDDFVLALEKTEKK